MPGIQFPSNPEIPIAQSTTRSFSGTGACAPAVFLFHCVVHRDLSSCPLAFSGSPRRRSKPMADPCQTMQTPLGVALERSSASAKSVGLTFFAEAAPMLFPMYTVAADVLLKMTTVEPHEKLKAGSHVVIKRDVSLSH